mgnify:CR=1 FL=1
MPEDRSYEIPYPSSRQFTFDVGKLGREKHHIKALLEVDVTEARRKIKQSRQAGRKISVTTWLIKVLADSVALHPLIAGVNRPRQNTVVVFDDVDISLVIEKEVNGTRVPLPYVIRKADQKTLDHIREEIETAKLQVFEDEGNYVLGNRHNPLAMKLFLRLPQWLRLAFMRVFVCNNPQRLKHMMGNVMLTTVGMVGHGRGWIMPYSIHPLCLAISSLNEQPALYRGEIQQREMLHVTVLIDHDVIDGMPAARFVNDFARRLEDGYGL